MTKLASSTAWLFALIGIANATCRFFEPTSVITATGTHPFGSTNITGNYGVPLDDQIQQVTPGITCNNATDFNAHHKLTEFARFTCEGLGYRTCDVESSGNIYARAATNISKSNQQDQEAEDRITALALQQVNWPPPGKAKIYKHGYHTLVRGLAQHSGSNVMCLESGKSGWMNFIPLFHCVEGVLKGCEKSGTKIEQNNQAVAVCMPYALTGPPIEIPGFQAYSLVSEKVVEQHRKNPALDQPAPKESLSVMNYSSSLQLILLQALSLALFLAL